MNKGNKIIHGGYHFALRVLLDLKSVGAFSELSSSSLIVQVLGKITSDLAKI